MSYLEKLKAKISPLEELPKVPKEVETKNKATPPTAKSAKSPFDSFGSTPGSRFSENQDPGTSLKVEPMEFCLHGKKGCHYLRIYSKVLGKKAAISWQEGNSDLVFLDSVPYTKEERDTLKNCSPSEIKAAHLVKGTFDGEVES